jgi:biopolymer transport protein ExbD
MALQSKNKIDPSFSMSSMTDIVFLLLIFFMLTASFVTPNGLNVNLPTTSRSEIVMQKVSVSITDDLRYYVNDQEVDQEGVRDALTNALATAEEGEGVVVLHVDKNVPTQYFVTVAGIGAEVGAKVTLATKPE